MQTYGQDPLADQSRSTSRAERTHGRGSHRAKHPQGRGRKTLIAILIVVALILAGILGYGVYSYFSLKTKLAPDAKERKQLEAVLDQPAQDAAATPFEYLLLLGNDKRPGEKRARTDTIIVARLNRETREVVLLSIPRDTRVNVPGRGMTKINHAGAWGGPALSIQTVKEFTGLPVNHYVQIDFQGFEQIVNDIGGIDMYVSAPVDYGQGVTVGAGQQHLNGAQALAVMRNRHAYGSGDFARMRNQQSFLSAVARKMLSSANLSRLPTVLNRSADHIETDLSMSQIVDLARHYRSSASKPHSYSMPGVSKRIDGVSYVIANPTASKALFEQIKNGETPAPQPATPR